MRAASSVGIRVVHETAPFRSEGAEAVAGAMLVACRLAGLSALGAHYAGVKWRAMRTRGDLTTGWPPNCSGPGMPQRAMTSSRSPSGDRLEHPLAMLDPQVLGRLGDDHRQVEDQLCFRAASASRGARAAGAAPTLDCALIRHPRGPDARARLTDWDLHQAERQSPYRRLSKRPSWPVIAAPVEGSRSNHRRTRRFAMTAWQRSSRPTFNSRPPSLARHHASSG